MVRKGRSARGDNNGSRLYPERLKRGDDNVSRRNPELLKPPKGETHPHSILTESEVLEIRDEFNRGYTRRLIADTRGLDYIHVYKITERTIWRHI
jgi:hypothetical protein